jgi:hypothetical protein
VHRARVKLIRDGTDDFVELPLGALQDRAGKHQRGDDDERGFSLLVLSMPRLLVRLDFRDTEVSAEFAQLIRIDAALDADDGQLLRLGYQNRKPADLSVPVFTYTSEFSPDFRLRTPTIRDQAGVRSCVRGGSTSES